MITTWHVEYTGSYAGQEDHTQAASTLKVYLVQIDKCSVDVDNIEKSKCSVLNEGYMQKPSWVNYVNINQSSKP